jgi:polysaccharide chain length determinant protein (PEP-CTERM system associated)
MQNIILRILDEVRGTWRFRWFAVAGAWVVCLLGWAYVVSLPNVYQATARVYLDTQSALRPLLKGLTVDPEVESNLAIVRQAILSRPHIEKVAKLTQLDQRAETPEETERLISSILQHISIENDARSPVANSDGLYRISFQDFSRAKSLQVVQELLDSFVEDTLGIKRTGQEDAQKFLHNQISLYEGKLSAAENRLSEFKKQNVGRMPDDRGDYFNRLQTEMTGLEQVKQTLSLAVARRDAMQKQLTGEEPFVFGFDQNGSANLAAETRGGAGGDVAARIRDLEHRKEELLLRFTEKHPEVLAVQDTINQLKTQEAAELERVGKGQAPTGTLAQSLKTNPVYQSIQVQMKATDVQIAELRQDATQREARVADLRRLVNTVPEVEAELSRLNRDYEITRSEYQQLVQRLQQAKLSDDADKTGVVKFKIIEPPGVSLDPIAPNRLLMMVAVLLIGMATGIGLAYGLNLIRPVFQNSRSLGELTGLPVLGVVSRTWMAGFRAHSRRSAVALSGCFILLLAAAFLLAGPLGSKLSVLIFS